MLMGFRGGQGKMLPQLLVLFCRALQRGFHSHPLHLLALGTSRSRWWKHGLVLGWLRSCVEVA